jgi:Xaa-Pro aminopeptidase
VEPADRQSEQPVVSDGRSAQSVVSDRITMAPPVPRLRRVTEWMAANGLDALVVTGSALVAWITGYARYYGGDTAAVVTPDGHRTLIALRDEVAVAEQISAAESVVGYSERGFGLELNPVPLLVDAVLKVGAVAGASRIGVAGDLGAAVAGAAAAATVEADAVLHEMSLVKDPDELTKIFRSYELCWLAHAAVAEGTAIGKSEIEMFSSAHYAAQVDYGSPVEFGADLLAGGNTAEVCAPVAVAGPRQAGPGDPVVADLSVGAGGYWADTCRTYVHGSNAEVDEIRAQLYEIMDAGAASLRDGTSGSDVFRGIREGIAAAWPDGEFPHHAGHGVGLSVFDDPHLIPADSRPVRSWMVMAMEPGVYLPGRFGVRNENLFLVTPDGGVELSQAMARPLSPRALEAWRS